MVAYGCMHADGEGSETDEEAEKCRESIRHFQAHVHQLEANRST